MDQEKKLSRSATFKVSGEDPKVGAAPIFSNFVGISQVGTEVQFEFIFLDINLVAQLLEAKKRARPSEEITAEENPVEVVGKTVAKIVMPAAAFLQLKDHLMGMFERYERAGQEKEGGDEFARSGV